jgi:hypothetical protein
MSSVAFKPLYRTLQSVPLKRTWFVSLSITFVATPTDAVAVASWIHGKLVSTVSGVEGIGVVLLINRRGRG